MTYKSALSHSHSEHAINDPNKYLQVHIRGHQWDLLDITVGTATAQITISLQNVQNQLQGSLPGQGLAKDDNGLDFGEVGIILNRLLGPQFTINPIQVGVGFAHIILIKKNGSAFTSMIIYRVTLGYATSTKLVLTP